MILVMVLWRKVVRSVALALLVSAAVDLFVVDLVASPPCARTVGAASTSEPGQRPDADDDCFCCCSHIVPGRAPDLARASLIGPQAAPQEPAEPASKPTSIYHPPRA